MNRYVVDGAMRDAKDGRRVLVLVATEREARAVFDRFAQYAARYGGNAEIRHAARHVEFARGSLAVCRGGRELRGRAADVVVMLPGTEAHPAALGWALADSNAHVGDRLVFA